MSRAETRASKRSSRPARLQRLIIQRGSMIEAHAALGATLGTVIRRVARQRLRQASSEELAQSLNVMRLSREHLLTVARKARQPALRSAVSEYWACLSAWAEAAQLDRLLPLAAKSLRCAAPPLEQLALWLQDDNPGCQTGMLRTNVATPAASNSRLPTPDSRPLFWHTEEDTSGYLDRARLVTITVPQGTWHAFLYPYLLPGPAFCFTTGRFFALDSLHIRRRPIVAGTLSATVAWLVWRLAGELLAADVIGALAPFIDGAAINEIDCRGERVLAATHEFGQSTVQSRLLPNRLGSLQFQVNAICKPSSRLGRAESLTAGEREKYMQRCERTAQAIGKMAEPDAEQIVRLLADRRGGEYAYANNDVKAWCVGVAERGRLEVHVGAGMALPGVAYRPQFTV